MGNFHIKLTALKDNTYKYAQFTFQIGLHKDEIKVLEYIMNTRPSGHLAAQAPASLKCGHSQRSRKSQRDLKFRGAAKILRLRAGQEFMTPKPDSTNKCGGGSSKVWGYKLAELVKINFYSPSVNFNIRLTNLSFPFLVPEGFIISIRHYSTSNDTPSEFVPVKKYANAYTEKLKILQDNKNKAGVYR